MSLSEFFADWRKDIGTLQDIKILRFNNRNYVPIDELHDKGRKWIKYFKLGSDESKFIKHFFNLKE